MRQIPYTMMKFACFERTVEALYKYVVPKPRSECTKGEQLVVTFVAGYIGKESLKSYTSLMDYCNSRDLLAVTNMGELTCNFKMCRRNNYNQSVRGKWVCNRTLLLTNDDGQI